MRGSVLALIPARSGSQRVSNKNIRLLGGKPLIAYTIEAALKASKVNRVVVSTDCEKIAAIAREYGAEVPFLRPSDISGPESTEYAYHMHCLDTLRETEDYRPSLVVNLYPTTPFRTARSIDRAIEKIQNCPEADSLRSTRKCSEHPYKMWVQEGDFLKPFVPKTDQASHTLSYHLLPPVHIQNASIYIVRPSTLQRFQSTVGDTVLSFEMSEEESVDINSPLDFTFAEFLLASQNRRNEASAEELMV